MNAPQDTTRPLVSLTGFLPLVILLVAYSILILAASGLLTLSHASSSPFIRETELEFLGGHFVIATGKSAWADTAFAVLVYSLPAQQAMFATWAVFTRGRWYFRFVASLTAAALLYLLMQATLGVAHVMLKYEIGPFLLMPLVQLCLAAPLSALAIASGRRLHRDTSMSSRAKARHFSVANLLLLTAVVAVAISLARQRWAYRNEHRLAVVLLLYSTIHVLPLNWCLLAIRRWWLALCSALSITVVSTVPFIILASKSSEWAIVGGAAAGLVWTVPSSLLLWRVCGYRLAGGEGRCDLTENRYNSVVLESCGERIDAPPSATTMQA